MMNTHRRGQLRSTLVQRLSMCLVVITVTASVAFTAQPSPAGNGLNDAAETASETEILAPYGMAWWSVDGGGGSSSGGVFALTGGVGQPDTGVAGGCGTAIEGGLWSGVVPCSTPLFCDGFETGDAGAWSSVTP